ncbi:hypothetical protein ACNHUS_35300 [Actinomycetes bacterium M1A6_2h]
MGASTFIHAARGESAAAAFSAAREQALYECGHGGYTGTIAEKSGFTVIDPPADSPADAQTRCTELLDADDRRISDKWGPAGCIHLRGTDHYLFFGWACQ